LKHENFAEYENSIALLMKSLTLILPNMKYYIQEVIRKASINKASKLYEHGLSMEQTSKLLGITQWELSDYIGQSPISEAKESQTVDIKKRAKLALEFFEK
jgi:predicted transcriptional regulator